MTHKGNTAQRPPYGLAPHLLRPKEVPLGYSFSVILHKTRLITVRLTTLVLHILTKKLTAHLWHYLCAVLPKNARCQKNRLCVGITDQLLKYIIIHIK